MIEVSLGMIVFRMRLPTPYRKDDINREMVSTYEQDQVTHSTPSPKIVIDLMVLLIDRGNIQMLQLTLGSIISSCGCEKQELDNRFG